MRSARPLATRRAVLAGHRIWDSYADQPASTSFPYARRVTLWETEGGLVMLDVLALVAVTGVFAAAVAYAFLCERL
ncbi:MAG: hypothetical protein U1E42_08030 [Rhodospirillales bacterium]